MRRVAGCWGGGQILAGYKAVGWRLGVSVESFQRVVCPVPPLQAPALSQILETQASTGFKDTPQTASMRERSAQLNCHTRGAENGI